MNKVALVIVAPLFALVAACGGDKKPAAAPAPAATTEAPSVTSAPAKKEQLAVNVDDAILKACNLKFANVEEAPKFDFDSEQLTDQEKAVLEQVAKCLTTGPLKGRAVDLVGRADPRGETEYNMTLGAKRARAAHTFLAGLGVASDKLFDTSRGELDATGTDEQGWKKDRRVDVKLRGN
ncbi:MAG TPA: OmpA family protein [Labilithrix sp.]|nr:OmpA family protein [Labilithrix sp.]